MNQHNDNQIDVDSMATNKMRPLQEPSFELTTHDLVPVEIIKIRRDKTSSHDKIRNKYLNLSSNFLPTKILINNIEAKFKVTRGFGIIKINLSKILSGYNSGFHQIDVRLMYSDGMIQKIVKLDLRSRKHHTKRIQEQLDND